MQKDIAKRIELLTILILSFSPQLISLHNVSVTEYMLGTFSHWFFAEFESSKTSQSIPFCFNCLSSVCPSNHLPPLHPISPYLLVPFLPTNLSLPSTTHSYASFILLSLPSNPSVNPPFLLSHFSICQRSSSTISWRSSQWKFHISLKNATMGRVHIGHHLETHLEGSHGITLWSQPIYSSYKATLENYPIKPSHRTII